MPDRRPDPDEVETGGDTVSTSGGRRAGLDRLRAARGGAATTPTGQAGTGGDRPTGADRASAAETTASRAGRSGSTTLLEPAERSGAAGTDAADTKAADTRELTEEPGAKGKPRRRRGAAAGVSSTTVTPKRATQRTGAAEQEPSMLQFVTLVVLGLVIIGLAIPVVLMRHRIFGQSSEQKAITRLVDKETDATDFARRFAVTFFSPDYKTIDNYNNTISAQTTGDFQKDFNGRKDQLKTLLTQVQSQATGKVLAIGVSKVSGDNVELLVVVDQDVMNTTTKGKAVTNRYRVRETLLKTKTGWLVQGLDPVT